LQEELYALLTDRVGALPGVGRLQTAPFIRTVRQASPVVVPVRLKIKISCPNGPFSPLVRSGKLSSRPSAMDALGPAPEGTTGLCLGGERARAMRKNLGPELI
jgi:hypothetical protein